MSIYSPTVLPRSGMGNAGSDFVNALMGYAQNKRDNEDRDHAKTLEKIQLAEQGIHILGKGEVAPFESVDVGSVAAPPNPFQRAFAGGDGPATKAGVTQAGSPTPTPPSASNAFMQLVMDSFPKPPAQTGRYEYGEGYYRDRKEADANTARKTATAGQAALQGSVLTALPNVMKDQADRDRRKRTYGALPGVTESMADAAAENPSLADNLPPFVKPTPVSNPERITSRIKELVAGGESLAEANKRARLEFGETNAQDAGMKGEMQKMQRVLSLQGHFNTDRSFTQAQDIASAYQKIRSAAEGEHTATSDMSLVYGLMKLQDPGSTVREGEYASAANAKGVPDQIQNLYNKVIDGSILSDRQRQQFLQTADGLAKAHRQAFSGTLQRYGDMAKRYEVDPRDVTFDPFDAVLGPADSMRPTAPVAAAHKTPGQLWDEAVKKHGEAVVLEKFGPRPPE